MIILEQPYVSDLTLDWLERSGHPVLDNAFARTMAEGGEEPERHLNLVSQEDAIKLVDGGQRVYTCSENALDWVLSNTHNENLNRCIRLCKDKASTRRALAALDGALFFRECTLDQLLGLDTASLPFPLVVKPAVGFVSFGVHVIPDAGHWARVIAQLQAEMEAGTVFPASVIGSGRFVLEGFITGQEYAVDVYFDHEGLPVIVDVMQHDFRDENDTSDHLYFTSGQLMRAVVPSLTRWFALANDTLGFRDFCAHVELRVSHEEGQDPAEAMRDPANIHVIEFNPLRFAGFCGTDIAWYAHGVRTYACYLEDGHPDWNAPENDPARQGAWWPGIAACSVVEQPTEWQPGRGFDAPRFEAGLLASCEGLEICEPRLYDIGKQGLACFPVYRVPENADWSGTRAFILNMDPNAYLI